MADNAYDKRVEDICNNAYEVNTIKVGHNIMNTTKMQIK